MPLTLVVRDMLGLAKSAREVRYILHNELGQDRRTSCQRHPPWRWFDGRLDPWREITTAASSTTTVVFATDPSLQKEAGWKVCRIEGKTTIKGGQTQLNLHDGRNIIVDDPRQYNTGDSLKLNLPDQKDPRDTSASEKAHAATSSVAPTLAPRQMSSEYIVKRSSMPNEVQFGDFGTVVRNVFAFGDASMPLTEVAE
jgi:small subunit ribosomal protein S4e